MREQIEKALKFTCFALAVFLAYQSSHMALRKNPLAGISIPALPSLPSSTNSPASATNTIASNTKAPASTTNADDAGTKARLATVHSPANSAKAPEPANANSGAIAKAGSLTNTNPSSGTNLGTAGGGSNDPPRAAASRKQARASSKLRSSGPRGGRGGAEKPPELPPGIQARVDRIYQSQLLGPVMRPSIMPAGLLGIAGNFAILRTTTGQTGLVKEGDELSGLKLLRIGINRVLVEQDGKQKELTLFNGFGGESLLPPTKDNPK